MHERAHKAQSCLFTSKNSLLLHPYHPRSKHSKESKRIRKRNKCQYLWGYGTGIWEVATAKIFTGHVELTMSDSIWLCIWLLNVLTLFKGPVYNGQNNVWFNLLVYFWHNFMMILILILIRDIRKVRCIYGRGQSMLPECLDKTLSKRSGSIDWEKGQLGFPKPQNRTKFERQAGKPL